MRAVIQRVSSASVSVDGKIVGKIWIGYMILLGVTHDDTLREVEKLAEKISKIRLFPDDDKPINRSITDVDGEILLVSQFTLYGDTRKWNRPSFVNSAKPDHANELYGLMKSKLEEKTEKPIQCGIFWAMMEVSLINDGPVTLLIEANNWQK